MDSVYIKRGVTPDQLEPVREYYQWDELDQLAEEMVWDIVTPGKKIGVLYDPDVDGLMSGYILNHYLNKFGRTVSRHMNKDKVHGLKDEAMDWVHQEDLDILFIVDAGSGDHDTLNQLAQEGRRVVVLDHHDYTPAPLHENVTIINASNHDPVKYTSGCGVVYYFIEAVAQHTQDSVSFYEKYVGTTIISDICSMKDATNRYFVKQTFNSIHDTPVFSEFPFYGSPMSLLGFTIIPYFNAMIRCNYTEEVMTLSDHFERRSFKKEKAKYDHIKQEQRDRVEELKQIGELVKLNGLTVLLRGTQEVNYRPFNGLVANQYLSEYKQSAIVLEYYPETETYEGSFRGYDINKDALEEYGALCQGHDQACGVTLTQEQLYQLLMEFDHNVERKDTVDFKVHSSVFTRNDWVKMSQFNEYYGIDLPKISVEIVDEEPRAVQNKNNGRQIYVYDNIIVTAFKNNTSGDAMVVEPTLDRQGYQLIKR